MTTALRLLIVAMIVLSLATLAVGQCPDLGTLDCATQGTDIVLSWALPGSYSSLTLYRDGASIAVLPGTDTTFIDQPPVGVYVYELIADCGASSFGCTGAFGVTGTFSIDSVSGVPGTVVDVPVRLSSSGSAGVNAAGFGISHDGALLSVSDAFVSGALAETNLANGPGFTGLDLDPVTSGAPGITFFFLVDLIPPLNNLLPSGDDLEILTIQYQISPLAPVDVATPLQFTEELGDPLMPYVINLETASMTPTTPPTDGQIEIVENLGVRLIRGDADGNGSIALADVISTLQYLFAGGSAPCLDALDCNDDGSVALNDVIAGLNYLFSGGQAPAAPFPDCGWDDTDDPLDCDPGTPICQ